ncbi:MAG TPA: Imm70 family immunity protein [Humisphaera sp.]
MGVTLRVGDEASTDLGTADFVHCFFSTIAVRLEGETWGSRFPDVMRDLYNGRLRSERVAQAVADLSVIRSELAAFPPDQAVWDIDRRWERPPWGDEISPAITSLANYFWTGDGRDLFVVLLEELGRAAGTGSDVHLE